MFLQLQTINATKGNISHGCQLHQAYLHHRYWTFWLMAIHTKNDFSEVLAKIDKKLAEPPDNNWSVSLNLCKVQQHLREIHCTAKSRCKEYLQTLLDVANQTDDIKQQRLILHLCTAEQNHKYFVVAWTAHETLCGGWSHLFDSARLYQSRGMENNHRPKRHWEPPISSLPNNFKQAHSSPYMIPLLAKLLYYNSLTPFGQQVLDGTANLHNLNISHHTRLLLHHQKAPKPMPFKEMMKGFQKWPECSLWLPPRDI